jgi:uncharacterized membrane protein YphA (DoxX/SURF4 family)
MLNLFAIQFMAPLAYLMLRMCLGIILIRFGCLHIQHRHSLKEVFSLRLFPFGSFFVWYLGIVEIVLGSMLMLGLFTQLAALLTMLLSLKFIIMHKRFSHQLIPSRIVFVLMGIISVSLFITGAGAFAIDLPI